MESKDRLQKARIVENTNNLDMKGITVSFQRTMDPNIFLTREHIEVFSLSVLPEHLRLQAPRIPEMAQRWLDRRYQESKSSVLISQHALNNYMALFIISFQGQLPDNEVMAMQKQFEQWSAKFFKQ